MKIISLISLILLIVVASCTEELPVNQIDFEFEQSDYFVVKDCDEHSIGRMRMAVGNQIDTFYFAIKIKGDTIGEFMLPPPPFGNHLGRRNIEIVEFNLPKHSEFKTDSLTCVAESIGGLGVRQTGNQQLYTSSILEMK